MNLRFLLSLSLGLLIVALPACCCKKSVSTAEVVTESSTDEVRSETDKF